MEDFGTAVFSALYYELYDKAEAAGYKNPVGYWYLKLAHLAQEAAQAERNREG
jgi:hypothetical protein